MYGNDYPEDHLPGLSYEAMICYNTTGEANTRYVENNGYEYIPEWK